MDHHDDDQLREATLREAAERLDFPFRVPARLSSGWEFVTGNLWCGDDDRWAYAMHLRESRGAQDFWLAQCPASAWSLQDWHGRRGEVYEAAVGGYETVHVRRLTESWPQRNPPYTPDKCHSPASRGSAEPRLQQLRDFA
jgi:hypothetical protein